MAGRTFLSSNFWTHARTHHARRRLSRSSKLSYKLRTRKEKFSQVKTGSALYSLKSVTMKNMTTIIQYGRGGKSLHQHKNTACRAAKLLCHVGFELDRCCRSAACSNRSSERYEPKSFQLCFALFLVTLLVGSIDRSPATHRRALCMDVLLGESHACMVHVDGCHGLGQTASLTCSCMHQNHCHSVLVLATWVCHR